jgi:hypothetical protein
MRRALALAALLVLAGCGGSVPGGEEPTDAATLTPATVPSAAPETLARVPGYGERRLADPAAAARGHRRALDATSYRIERVREVTGRNGTLNAVALSATVAADREAYRFSRIERSTRAWVASEPYARIDIWYRNTSVRNRFLNADRTARYWGTNISRRGGPVTDPTQASVVVDALGAASYEVENTTRTGDHTVYRIAGGERTERGLGPVPPLVSTPRNLSLTARIRDDGAVLAYDLRYRATFENRTVTVRERHRVTRVGTATVERPEWLARANESVVG